MGRLKDLPLKNIELFTRQDYKGGSFTYKITYPEHTIAGMPIINEAYIVVRKKPFAHYHLRPIGPRNYVREGIVIKYG
jgi:hypothetical protein